MTTATDDQRRTHEVRIGMSIFHVITWPESVVDGMAGHRWSDLPGRLTGWTAGSRRNAVAQAREALRAAVSKEGDRP